MRAPRLQVDKLLVGFDMWYINLLLSNMIGQIATTMVECSLEHVAVDAWVTVCVCLSPR